MEGVELKNYKITWDPIDDEKIPEALSEEIEELYLELPNPSKFTLKRLQGLIKKYPEVAMLRNFLSKVYSNLGESEKAQKTIELTVEKFPDYLFGRTNKAHLLILEERYVEVEGLLGEHFDLVRLYPDRDTFHVTEFLAMQYVAASYYINTNDFEQAKTRIELMKEVDPDAEEIEQAQYEYAFKLGMMQLKQKSTLKNKPGVVGTVYPESRPNFNYDITLELYDYGFDIPESLWKQFLTLDRAKVIEDLENIIKNSIQNHKQGQEYFNDEAPLHAIFILGELEAEEGLPMILEMMQQSEDYFDAVLGDLFLEVGWICMFKMSKDRISLLEDYLKKPGIPGAFKMIIIETIAQIYIHLPDKREDITAVYKRLLTFFIQEQENVDVIDDEFNGFLIADLIDLKLDQFLPEIEEMYSEGLVDPTICGLYSEVEEGMEIEEEELDYYKRELLSLGEIYKDLGFNDFYIPDDFSLPSSTPLTYNDPVETYQRKNVKVNRNDPCPCGSGKKFKKCCLGEGLYD